MTDWTPEEIRELYALDQKRRYPDIPFSEKSLASRLITLFEMWIYGEDMLTRSETRREFEKIIRERRAELGERMSGLSEQQVEQDPDVARRKLAVYILNRIRALTS